MDKVGYWEGLGTDTAVIFFLFSMSNCISATDVILVTFSLKIRSKSVEIALFLSYKIRGSRIVLLGFVPHPWRIGKEVVSQLFQVLSLLSSCDWRGCL